MSVDLTTKSFQPVATKADSLKWSVIAAVNNQEVLQSCLLQSPEVAQATDHIWQQGYPSAAQAYNVAMDRATTDVLVFAHQDVFLPAGWLSRVQQALAWFAQNDPQWAVAGIWGVKSSGERHGNVYCTGLGEKLGTDFTPPVEVRTVDELLFIVRKSSGIRFDEVLPGYHMYGTDICLAAQRQGLKCYAISAFCIHNTNGYGMLPWEFWKSYLIMRRKWKKVLPVITPCTEITQACGPMLRWNVVQAANLILKRHKVGKRVPDPAQLYRELVAANKVRPVTADR
jgi:GT2 family glycosyltransferase